MVEIKDNQRILFIGDSITDVRYNRKNSRRLGVKAIWAMQVTKELKKKHKSLKFFYRGIAGNCTYHVYDRLTRDCIGLKPDVIVMLLGVNDAWENYLSAGKTPILRPMEPHAKEIFRRIKTELPNAKLIYLLPFLTTTIEEKQPFRNLLDEYVIKLRDIADGNADEIIPLQEVFNEEEKTISPALLSRDSIHPTNLGHEVIAKAVLNKLA